MSKINNLSTLSLVLELYKNIPSRKKLSLYFLFSLMILSAFSEILTLSAVIPFLSIVINPKGILSYPIVSFFINLFDINPENLSFYIFISFVIIILFSGLVRLFTLFTTFKVSANIGSYLSSKF